MLTYWNAAPGEWSTDVDRDDEGYDDARCVDCGAGADERCTDDCGCADCEGDADDDL